MSPETRAPSNLRLILLLLPLLAGWCVGFFLREVQATVVPYQTFLVLGSLAGQIQFTPPHRILLYAEIGVLVLWLVWSWLLHRRSRRPLLECMARDAWSYVPLLVLPGIALIVDIAWMRPLKYLFDPLILVAVATICAIKSWHWTTDSHTTQERHSESSGRWVWVLFLVSAITFSMLGILQFHSWNVPAADTGQQEEMLWNTLHGRFLYVATRKEIIFATHVMLTQLLWLPLYALWPSVDLLTILQSVAVASGVFPVWWLARRKWSDHRALLFPLLYLLQPALHFANAELNYNTYRIEAFLIPMILFGIHFLEKERWWQAGLFGLLVLLTREDMGIVVASVGAYLALAKGRWWMGLLVAAIGVGYFGICIRFVIPHFTVDAQYPFVATFEGLGNSPAEIAGGLINKPQIIWNRLWQSNNLLFISYLLVPLGLVSAGSPSLALTAAPILGLAMLTQTGVQGSIYFHYHNAPFALLVAAAPAGAATVASRLSNLFHSEPSRVQSVVLTFALSAGLIATILGSKTPLSLNFYHPSTSPFHYSALYLRTPHTDALEKAKRLIPPEARVSATIFASTHLTHQADCRTFPDDYQSADYVLVDLKARWKKGAQTELQKWGEGGLPGFDPIWIEDGVFLFKRRPVETLPKER